MNTTKLLCIQYDRYIQPEELVRLYKVYFVNFHTCTEKNNASGLRVCIQKVDALIQIVVLYNVYNGFSYWMYTIFVKNTKLYNIWPGIYGHW